jgi:hypothetical protein
VTVRADWHTPELVVPAEEDIFDQRIEDVGLPVRLDAQDGEAELNEALVRNVEAEVELAAQGVTCAIKDCVEASCHACPIYRDDDSPEGQLCRLGREQERIATHLLAARLGR